MNNSSVPIYSVAYSSSTIHYGDRDDLSTGIS